jgi:hypothetical protein
MIVYLPRARPWTTFTTDRSTADTKLITKGNTITMVHTDHSTS